MRTGLILTLLVTSAALGGCSQPPVETPAEAMARHARTCQEAGFVEGTSDYKLCLLLQRSDDRLEAVERRLSRIDLDTRFSSPFLLAGPYYGPRYWPYGHYFW